MAEFAKFVGFCALMSLAACGRSSDQDQKQNGAYETARTQREALLKKLRATPAAQANRCEVSDGDCLIEVGEKRESLFAPKAACEGRADQYRDQHTVYPRQHLPRLPGHRLQSDRAHRADHSRGARPDGGLRALAVDGTIAA